MRLVAPPLPEEFGEEARQALADVYTLLLEQARKRKAAEERSEEQRTEPDSPGNDAHTACDGRNKGRKQPGGQVESVKRLTVARRRKLRKEYPGTEQSTTTC